MVESSATSRRTVVPEVFFEVFKASPIGIVLEDLQGRPLFVNRAFCSMLGFSEEEILTKHRVDFSPSEDAEKDWALFQKLRAGSIEHYHLDKRYFRKDGSLVWGHLSISLLNHRPAPLVIAMVEDITEKVVDISERKKLEEQQSRHAAIVESTADAIVSMSLEGVVLSWNQGARRLFGYTESEAVGQPIAVIVPDHLRDQEKDILRRLRNGEHIKPYETVRITKAARPIDISVAVSPIKTPAGEIVSVCSICQDITERKQSETSLLWRLQFESLLSDLSRTFISLPEEEIDANMERSLALIGEFLHLDRITLYALSADRRDFMVIYAWTRVGVTKTPMSVRTKDLPWWTSRVLNGEVTAVSQLEELPQEVFAEKEFLGRAGILSVASIPLNVSGQITGTIAFSSVQRHVSWTPDVVRQLRVIGDIFSNALKRKRAMEDLRAAHMAVRESEERFRLVANTTPAMIWMSGVDKRCTYFNQTWLEFTGRPLESELGEGWVDDVHPDDLQRSWTTYAESFEQRKRFQVEYRLRRHDGQYHWFFDSGVPRFDLDGTFAGYIGSCVDVTERKQAEALLSNFSQKLIQAQEQERAAVGRELHDDVNQRVALTAMNLEMLLSDPSISTAVRKEVIRVMEQLRELAGDIQSLSHRLHSSKLDQLGLIRAASGFCKEVSAKHKVRIEFQSRDVPEKLPADVSLCLYRVIQEAVQNATRHSGSTDVQVLLTRRLNEMQLVVKDSGKGFDLSEALNAKGIGLTGMQERLKLVNGQLSIQTAPGRGTEILARLPLKD